MKDENMQVLPEDLLKILSISTSASQEDLATDDWDSDYNCSYSADGLKLLDAENFPDEVNVREGTRIICDNVFSFQPYMAEDRPIGSEIPEEERVSFLDKIHLPDSLEHIGEAAFKECGSVV